MKFWCEPVRFDLEQESKPFVALFPFPTTEIQISSLSKTSKDSAIPSFERGATWQLCYLVCSFVRPNGHGMLTVCQ